MAMPPSAVGNGGITAAKERVLLRGARTLAKYAGETGPELIKVELLCGNGQIEAIAWGGQQLQAPADARVIDLGGALVLPGLADVHIHLREPGQEAKETIKTGTRAAARGGWTSVCAMPNTVPDPHTPELLARLWERIEADACVRVFPFSPITVGLRSDQVVDIGAQVAAGAIGFSNDGFGVQNAGTMVAAMRAAAEYDRPIATHSEDESIKRDGVINAGAIAQRYRLPGIDRLAEIVQVARDVEIAAATGARLHLCHASTAEAIRIARDARARGVRVSVEATPHHLLLVDEQIPGDDASWKMNPPLRHRADAAALIKALRDGTITVIATDNAPHLPSEKHCSFLDGAFGIVSNEVAFALLYTQLVRSGQIELETLVAALTSGPRAAYGLEPLALQVGEAADLAAFDIDSSCKIDPERFVGKARNTPFAGQEVWGDCILTVCGGNIVYQKGADSGC